MQILIGSDFHMEHRSSLSSVISEYQYYMLPDVIVLAGDIDTHTNIENTLSAFCELFEGSLVIYTPGNHEYYSSREYTMADIDAKIKALEDKIPNLRVGLNEVIVHNNVGFYVGTMWSNIDCKEEYQMVPAQEVDLIHPGNGEQFGPKTCQRLFADYKKGLIDFLHSTEYEKKVVVSHFSPSPEFDNPTVVSYGMDTFMKYYFCANITEVIEDEKLSPDVWIYGHTHYSIDRTLPSGCRVISCQLGYPKWDNTNWGKMETINIQANQSATPP